MYRVLCDGCKVSAQDGSDYYAWSDEDQARDDSREDGWMSIGDKDYCAGCWTWADDDETPIPKAGEKVTDE